MSALLREQAAFAARVRDPAACAVPEGVEPRRMKIYEDLVYNTIEGFAAGGFPVLRSLVQDACWHAMVRAFVATHRAHTPYFLRIAEEFLEFLAPRAVQLGLPPFAAELAHYEWAELALDVAEEEIPPAGDGDALDGVPLPSPLAWPLAYAWPVHRIGPGWQPDAPGEAPTLLVVYRDRADAVRFLETNAFTHRLLALVDEDAGQDGRTLLARLASEAGIAADETYLAAGRETLERLAALGVIAGFRPS